MKQYRLILAAALGAATLATPAFAASQPVVAEEFDHNIMTEIDPNLLPDPAGDATIVLPPDPATIGKPRPKAVKSKKTTKEIPLIDTSREAKSSEDVNFVTGGVGDDERESIEASKADYNLHVTSARADGAFLGDTNVVITRINGHESVEVLRVDAGPLLYVKLPAGTYTLDAQVEGSVTKQHKFTIGTNGKPATISLRW